MTIKCPKCGHENDESANFCSKCGQELKWNPDPVRPLPDPPTGSGPEKPLPDPPTGSGPEKPLPDPGPEPAGGGSGSVPSRALLFVLAIVDIILCLIVSISLIDLSISVWLRVSGLDDPQLSAYFFPIIVVLFVWLVLRATSSAQHLYENPRHDTLRALLIFAFVAIIVLTPLISLSNRGRESVFYSTEAQLIYWALAALLLWRFRRIGHGTNEKITQFTVNSTTPLQNPSNELSGSVRSWQIESIGGDNKLFTFRLERFDEQTGNRLSQIPVEMKGEKLKGSIREGDKVKIKATWTGGTLRLKQVYNETTNETVMPESPRSQVAVRVLMIPVIIVIIVLLITALSNLNSGPGVR